MKKSKILLFTLALILSGAALSADPPPIIPSNACQAQCLAEFRRCQAECRNVICLIPCEFLLDVCLLQNCPIR
jgi:hypothetical protein